jgi:hypothetical protein
MTIKQKRILLIAFIILLIILVLILIYYLFFQKSGGGGEININANTNVALPYNPPLNGSTNAGFQAVLNTNQIITPPSTDEVQVKTLSINFSEKIGSYSNQSDLVNFDDLFNITTANMQNYLSSLIATVNSEDDSYYHGITTKSLKVEISDLTDNTAETVVTTQRVETNESQNILNKIFYQDLKLKIVKSQGQWLVDGAWWQ